MAIVAILLMVIDGYFINGYCGYFINGYLLQPHFEGSARSPFTLPKMGLGSPLGLPKT
jgi:hypothetical protein